MDCLGSIVATQYWRFPGYVLTGSETFLSLLAALLVEVTGRATDRFSRTDILACHGLENMKQDISDRSIDIPADGHL